MPDESSAPNLTAWRSAVRARLGVARVTDAARAAVEMKDVPALIRAARAAHRLRRLPPAPDPAPAGRASVLFGFARDLAFGLRLLASRPGFTTVAVLTLALGIGANTAIFSVVNSVLLAPLPFPEAERLVMLWEADAKDPADFYIVAAPNWEDWARQSRSFEHTAIWEDQRFNIAGGTEQVPGLRVSSSVFAMLGVPAQLGRTFTADEDKPGHDVVVISDGLWRRRFASRRDVIGQTTRLNGQPFEIIGVMPASFAFVQEQFAPSIRCWC